MAQAVASFTDGPAADAIPRWFGVPQPLAILALPFVGYVLAFRYEQAFLTHFGLPSWLVRLDLTHVLVAVSALVSYGYTARSLLSSVPIRHGPALIYLLLVPGLLGCLTWMVAYQTEWIWGRHLVVPLLLLVVTVTLFAASLYHNLVAPLRRSDLTGDWWDRWAYEAWSQRKNDKPVAARPARLTVSQAVDESIERIGVTGAAQLIANVASVLAVTYYLGSCEAESQRSYLVSSSAPVCVAVRRYGEDLVCAVVDTAHRRFTGGYRFLKLDQPAEQLTLVPLGALRLVSDTGQVRKWFAAPRTPHPAAVRRISAAASSPTPPPANAAVPVAPTPVSTRVGRVPSSAAATMPATPR